MPRYVFTNCDLTATGPLRDGAGRFVEWPTEGGGVYTVQTVGDGTALASTAVLTIRRATIPGAPRHDLATPRTVNPAGDMTDALSPEGAVTSLDVTTAQSGKRCDVHVWVLPATPAVVGP